MARVIEIIEGEHGWTVIGDGRFAASLTNDEALWAVATLLMPEARPSGYLKTYEQEMAWRDSLSRSYGPRPVPVALLEDLRVRASAPTIARRMGIVRRTFDGVGQVINRFVQLKGNP